MLRNLRNFNLIKQSQVGIRHKWTTSVSTDHLTVTTNDEGISTLSMHSKPVNSLSLGFLKDFCEKIDLLEREQVKGVILTSSINNVFCAGLHLPELIRPDEARINAFWTFFQEAWIKLHGTPLATVALVNGHAVAGGCVFALSCEYRVMLRNYKIGLNESVVGILPPQFVNALTRSTISTRHGELALTSGTLFEAEDALKLGMIDEIADNEDDALEMSTAFLRTQMKVPAFARGLVKQSYRKPELDLVREPKNRTRDAKTFIDHIMRPATQKVLIAYLDNLKAKKNQK